MSAGDPDGDYEPINVSPIEGITSHKQNTKTPPLIARAFNLYNKEPKSTSSSSKQTKKKDQPPPPLAKPRTRKEVSRAGTRPLPSRERLRRPFPDMQPESLGEEALAREPGEMSLQQFATTFEFSLPVRVVVTKGVYGIDEDSTISSADEYNIHSIRHRKIVKINDQQSNQQYSVPLNSAIKFGLVYDPNNNEHEAMRGMIFPKVLDILQMSALPKLVCVQNTCETRSPNSSLQQNEVLLIKKVVTSSTPTTSRMMMAYSFKDRCEKYLPGYLEGHFSTRPSQVQLYLPDILDLVPDPFPSRVVLFADSTSAQRFPSHFFTSVLSMTHQYTDVLLIATSLLNRTSSKEIGVPCEIPTDLDVDVKLVELTETEKSQLVAQTKELADSLKGEDVKHYKYVNFTDEAYRTQNEFYHLVREWRKISSAEPRSLDMDAYQQANEGSRLSIDKRLSLLETRVMRREEEMSAKVELIATNTDLLRKMYEVLEKRFEEQKQQLLKAQSQIETLLSQRKEAAPPPIPERSYQMPCRQTSTSNLETQKENREFLASLKHEQVGLLLICNHALVN